MRRLAFGWVGLELGGVGEGQGVRGLCQGQHAAAAAAAEAASSAASLRSVDAPHRPSSAANKVRYRKRVAYVVSRDALRSES